MTSVIKAEPAALVNALDFQALAREKMRAAIWFTLATVLEEEVSAFIGVERYERNGPRRDQRNGSYTRGLETSAGRLHDLTVPRTRKGFRTQLFERCHRRQAELDAAISNRFVSGASTARVGEVIETLTDEKPSPSTVSRVFHTLDGEFETWKKRTLTAHYRYIFMDGTYFTIIKAIFYQENREKADQVAAAFREKFRALYPTALECLERDWAACLTFYAFPKTHWKTIRTNNVIERLFGEVKKRSHKNLS